mmetsp:Transcript_62423/g.86798  ORF Transcript_62423/g.86798 Transcript_62423/m.86798 type:complete len:110 (+) Transcript_62423:603-932(+)
MEKIKALNKAKKNIMKLKNNKEKIQTLQGLLKDAVEEMKVVGPNLKKYYDEADKNGAPAAQNNKKLPGDIFDEYHKEGRMTEEEQKAYKEEKEGKGKKGKKDKKEEKKN